MAYDLAVDLIHATVRISQQQPDGRYGQGTGILFSAPRPDGTPRVVLVTADHVFADKMPAETVKVGLRVQLPTGRYRYAPQDLRIRYGGAALWTKHPARDVAAIAVQVPPEVARAAIPLAWLADAGAFERYGVATGDEMLQLGYPIGLSSTGEGFAVLRGARLSSYPLTPVAAYPTFLVDGPVFSGNSGGPVFTRKSGGGPPGADGQFIAGMIVQQVEYEGRQMDLGIAVHASFIRETIDALDAPPPPAAPPALVAEPAR